MPHFLIWETLSSKIGYDHPFFKVREDHVRLPNGHEVIDFSVWENPDVVQVLAVTPEKKIVLARQYKHGAGKIIMECPGGFVESDEDLEKAARRELREEVGYEAEKFIQLASFIHHPTKETSETHFFLALNALLSQAGDAQDETENIDVMLVSIDRALELIVSGELQQTGTVAGILMALPHLKALK